MTKFAFALLLTAFASTGAMAQGPAESVGVVQSVDGLVTVSQGNTLGNVVKDEKILNGARVVTTSTGSALVKLNNGCLISLAPNQSVTVDPKLDCKALVASIQSTGVGAFAAGTGVASGTGFGAFAAVSGAVGIVLIANSSSGSSSPPPPASGS